MSDRIGVPSEEKSRHILSTFIYIIDIDLKQKMTFRFI